MEDNRGDISKLSNTILVVTPISSIGKIIIQSLQEVGVNDIRYFPNSRSTISYLQKKRNCKVALLDLEMGEDAALALSNSLQAICPNINLVLISKDYLSEDFDYVRPWKLLQKPYQLADLLDVLEIIPSDTASSSIIDVTTNSAEYPNWLLEPALAKNLLAQMLAQTNAQGALVYHNNQLWSFAGKLSEKSIYDINEYVMKKWDNRTDGDFLGYPKVNNEEKTQVLYATSILLGVLLAVVFDVKIPVTMLRTQTKRMVSQLRQPELTSGDPIRIGSQSGLELLSDHNETKPVKVRSSILNNLVEENITKTRRSMDLLAPEEHHISLNPASIKNNKLLFNSGAKNQPSLSYTFQITPKNTSYKKFPFEDQDFVNWVSEIINAHGWSIDQLELKPESVAWTANVSPLISLANYIDIIRHELSIRIFEKFPLLQKEYPNGEFWTPGYDVRASSQAITNKKLDEL